MSLDSITTCLWFDGQAEEAANHYVSIFKNSRITATKRYTAVGQEKHGHEPGSVMIVSFELNGHKFVALNGGAQFKFSAAVSFIVDCVDQAEVDHYWEKLSDGGDPARQQCGWLADKFGVSWQVVPQAMKEMMSDKDTEKANRAAAAMFTMKKLDIAALRKAFDG